jgi:ferric-dicitrate binding protein FerR (iron transport regulator)
MIDRRHFIAGVLAAPLEAIGAGAAESVGSVVNGIGSAVLVRSTKRIPAAKGADVILDDLAVTGELSRLELQLGAGTHIKLGASTTLSIDRFIAGDRTNHVGLRKGAAFVDRPPDAEPNFSMSTPYALIAVRGTRFFAGPSNGVFGVFVQQGQVDVRTRWPTIRLTAGEGTDIAFPGACPTAPARWPDPRVAAAIASVN